MKRLFLVLFSLLILTVANVDETYASNRSSKTTAKTSAKASTKTSTKKVEVVKSTKVKSVNKLPKQAVYVKHNGTSYYTKDSKYYKKSGSKYVVVQPPFGLRVSVLPKHFVPFVFNSISYYCAEGIIYAQESNEYVVVEPVEGMIVPELPELNVNTLKIDGTMYYEFENVLYKEIPTAQGNQYRVVGTLD